MDALILLNLICVGANLVVEVFASSVLFNVSSIVCSSGGGIRLSCY